MEKEIIKGNVFIIPNRPMKESELINLPDYPAQAEWAKFKNRIHSKITLPESDAYIQIWCVTPGKENSNWGCHYEMTDPKTGKQENFVTYLPANIFTGKKEGDTVKFDSVWGHIELTLNQSSYRYRSFGAFHEVFSRLLPEYTE